MTASLMPPVMWGAGLGGAALTAADQPEEETPPHLGVKPQGAHSLCFLPCVVLSMIKSAGNIYAHVDIATGSQMVEKLFLG